MNRLSSWLRNIRISQILVVFLAGFIFLLGQAFSYVDVAQADVTSPEGTYYKGTPNGQGEIRNDTQINNTQKSQNPIKGAVDNIREKLNLDEKPPEATKEFFDPSTNRSADKTSSYEGSREGYYRTPSSN
ncbi:MULTISPECIES: hypothetical protein [unclassified Nostoc]|uniref:hypothetical protein n=1 Tax=unclassified Nostoc TaxID=2593658 RepID=UPI002AD49711|nr:MULTISPECIES: hypothetical protein [unclassified Nostoc]MDZ8031239.1 hypothetical protein [Nostoc sp. DedSLP04]MDZ8092628.1 hypothetical protein [Nostoc sp. DedQUE05]MDZ8132626.1 hypothetical protein [Nostoc sp. DedQUE07]